MAERLSVERKRLHPDGVAAQAVTRPEMGARLASMTSGARVEFGVTTALRDMFIVVTLPSGERIVETIHLPFLAGEWASLIESEATS